MNHPLSLPSPPQSKPCLPPSLVLFPRFRPVIPSQAFNSYSLLKSHLSSTELLLHFSRLSVGHIRWDHFWVLRSVPLTCVSIPLLTNHTVCRCPSSRPRFLVVHRIIQRAHRILLRGPGLSSSSCYHKVWLPGPCLSSLSPSAPPCGPAWCVGCESTRLINRSVFRQPCNHRVEIPSPLTE